VGEPEPQSVEPLSREAWRSWLDRHTHDGRGVWLVLHKGKNAPLTYAEAVEEAVAAGWIDSKANKLDERRYKLWMAPRKPKSGWALSNKERVARLTEQGLMTERGLTVVAAAKADGSWDSLDSIIALEVPADLQEALAAAPAAAAHFEAFPPGVKRTILYWIAQTTSPRTRRARIAEVVEAAAENVRVHQWRQEKERRK
jgi:uncharacterized protein YdeI (YjbR/CyaY-like superfamily)